MSTCMASYLHGAEQISLLGILACNACSTPYNPTASEEFRQIDPGSPFSALSGDWTCPHCPAPAAQFPVRESPGAAQALNIAAWNAAISALVADCKGLSNALTP